VLLFGGNKGARWNQKEKKPAASRRTAWFARARATGGSPEVRAFVPDNIKSAQKK